MSARPRRPDGRRPTTWPDPTRALAVVPIRAGVIAGVLLIGVAWGLAGGWAALSGALGVLVVLAFFVGGWVAVRWAVGLAGPGPLLGAFVTFTVQVAGLLVLLALLRDAAWLQRGWFAAGAVLTVAVWQVAQTIAYARARHPIYGEHSHPPHHDAPGAP